MNFIFSCYSRKEETVISTSIANVNVIPPGEKQDGKSENTTTSKDDYFTGPTVKQNIAKIISNDGVLQNSMSEVIPNLKPEQSRPELIEERIPPIKNTTLLNLNTEQKEKPSSIKPNNGSLSELSSTNFPKESSDSSIICSIISNQPPSLPIINSNDKENDASRIVVSSLNKLTTVLPASGSSIMLDKPADISVAPQVSPIPNMLTNKLPPSSPLTQFNVSTTHTPTIKPQVPLQPQSNYQDQVSPQLVEQQTPISFISSPTTPKELKNTSDIIPPSNHTASLSTQNTNFAYSTTKSTGSNQVLLNSLNIPISSQNSKIPTKHSVVQNASLLSTNGLPFETQKPKKPFTTFGLPNGWEKAISHTGRIYYKDHNTATTHWDLPIEIQRQLSTKVLPKNEPEVGIKPFTESLTAPKISLKNDAESKMKRSLSSPNLNESGADQLLKKPLPVIDRSSKPM